MRYTIVNTLRRGDNTDDDDDDDDDDDNYNKLVLSIVIIIIMKQDIHRLKLQNETAYFVRS